MLYPLWFIKNLILLNIFSYPIKFFIKKFKLKFPILIGIIYGLELIFYPRYIFNQPILALFYFSLGGYFAINQIDFEKIKNFVKKSKLIVIYFLGILTKLILYFQKIYSLVFTVFLSTICLFCIIGIIHNSRESKIKNLLLKLSKYVFPIFLLHEFNLLFLRKILIYKLPKTIEYITLEYFLCPIIILIFCVILAKIIKIISPKLYSVLFGER